MKNKFIFLISILALVAMIFLSGCAQKETQTSTTKEDTKTVTEAPTEKGIVDCKGDQTCLHSNFLACNPTEFKIPFIQDSEYSITILGIENGKCHYKISVTGLSANDCLVPIGLITEDRFGHFFGREKVPGKEKLAEEQQKIDADYCKQI